MNKKKRWSSIN